MPLSEQESFTVSVQLFGAFRAFGDANQVELHCEHPCTIAQIRLAFKQQLQARSPLFNEALLEVSVFANESSILSETALINQSTRLVVLPPISGG